MALDITFVGIKPNGKCFDFSVVNNAKVDVINFILTTPLDSVNTLEQLSNLNAYVKVESAGGDYIDKISATSVYDSENEELKISFSLHKKTTSYKNIALQLQFEDLQNEVISQTEIVALSLKGTINADKEVSDKYPEAIQELEKEVESYSGRIEEVEEKVENAVLKTDIVDNLNSEDDTKVLSAKQGKVLNDKISNAISGVYKPQGTTTIATLNALTITEEMNGFVYDMLDSGTLTKGSVQVMEGDNVAIIWNEDKTDWKWDKLSGLVDLSNYYNKSETDALLDEKVDESELSNYALLEQGLNVINANDIGGTFNETQLNILSNGKPTLIKGTFLNYNNLFVFNVSKDFDGYYVCLFKTEMANGRPNISCFRVNKNNGVYAEYPSYLGISVLFGKQLPNYPSNPTIPQIPIYDTDNTLKYVDTPNKNISDAYDNTKTYAVGDTCIYNNVLYKCTTAITTAEDFDATHWTATTVAELVADETINRFEVITLSSNTLTNDEVEKFKKGCAIDGTLSYTVYGQTTTLVNPTFYPCSLRSDRYLGFVVYTDNGDKGYIHLCGYTISSSNVLTLYNQNFADIGFKLAQGKIVLSGKDLPSYPNDLTKNYHLDLVAGVWTFVEY